MRGAPGRRYLRLIARSLAAATGKLLANRSEVWCAERSASAVPPEQLHKEVVRKQVLADTAVAWWDKRRRKPTLPQPGLRDLKPQVSRVPVCLISTQKPGGVDSQSETMDARVKMMSLAAGSRRAEQGSKAVASAQVHFELGMCRKLCEDGVISDALDALDMMLQQGLRVPKNLFYLVLKRSIQNKDLASGKRVHALTVRGGYEGNTFLATHLIGLYSSHGMLKEATEVFTKVAAPDTYNWTIIIFAYARHGGAAEAAEAIRLYRQMCDLSTVKPDDRLYTAVLKACAAAKDVVVGKEVHAHVTTSSGKPNTFLQAGLVNMYAKCGCLDQARQIFDGLSDKNVVTWTAMMAGYAQQGKGHEALNLYRSMQQEGLIPDPVAYVCLLQACASAGVGALHKGKQLHAEIVERGVREDAVLGGSLVNMYAKCGSLEDARRVFDKLSNKSIVAWTALIAGYAQEGMSQETLGLYTSMQQEGLVPDLVTYVCLLQSCAKVGVGALHEGTQLHAQIEGRGLEKDVVLGGSLVDMYAKCGSLEDARRLFDSLSVRNIVAWNAMLAGYAQQGMGEEALKLYSSMQLEGATPDSVTYASLLQACAAVAALPLGERLHAEIEKKGMRSNVYVGAALVNMYAKCGSICDAQQVFDSLLDRSIEAWNALMNGYARQGDSQVVFDLLARMKLQGVHPDEITFLSVLAVCSHAGLVDKGRECFEAMRTEHGISATMKHYRCMIDLLGRAGHLHEALQMAKNMPFPPDDVVWLTLLGACRKWKNVDIGQQAFQGAISIDERNAAAYVLMSNIYACTSMWEAAKEMRARRTNLGACKKPGQSWWTDMGGVVHTFLVGDKQHPESEGIYSRLDQLLPKMKKEGYVPHLESSLSDVSDEMKEAELCGHSEKLAIAYALNKTAEGTTIRIVKNLRVCEDCHAATAYISKVEKRTIICRDASRFHVYKDGKCSCGDYW